MKTVFRTWLSGLSAVIIISLLFSTGSPAEEWHPSGPSKDTKDWVQLKSGEWLCGNIDLFRDLKMEFDSEELDDLVIDWEDIIAFRAPREMTYVFEGPVSHTGSASMREGKIRINTKEGVREFDRIHLLSVVESSARERNFWSSNLSIGYTQRTGNTEQKELATRFFVKREATRSRYSIEYRGDFSEVSGVENVSNHKGNALLDLFVSRRFYITATQYEFYADKFQNIEYRNTLGVGLGYYIFRKSGIDWSIGIGGAYQGTKFLSVEEGQEPVERTGSVIPSTDMEWDITDDIEWELEYSSRLGVPDIKTSSHHAASHLSVDFYKDIFELTFSIIWDRVDNPKAFEDGTVPKKDDVKMVVGFGIDL
jgi:putative salt-induced outer membrane protein YdiY